MSDTGHTALVTGATGFVGRHLTRELLARGWTTHVLVQPTSALPPDWANRVTSHVCDGTAESVTQSVEQARPDVVFHLASRYLAQHTPDQVADLIQSNVVLGTQLAEAMTNQGCLALVNTGTGWQHLGQSDYDPVNLYAATKQAFEDILEYYVQARHLRVVTLKIFETYGPHDPRPKLLNALRQCARTQTPLDLSPGEQQLDLVYIDDAVDAFLLAADRLLAGNVRGHERYALSSGYRIQLRDLVALVERVLGLSVPVRWGARPYRSREVMVPWEGGATLPDWRCRVPLEEGLRRALKF